MRYQRQTVIVNYGMGNLGSVENALRLLQANFLTTNRQEDIRRADAVILPGVGAFGAAMENLRRLRLIDALTELVLGRRKPYLGICLGMQILAHDSEEQGFFPGLGWVDGHVTRLAPADELRVPHVGWNDIAIREKTPLLARIGEAAHFYFDHSFHLQCPPEVVTASADYGGEIVAAIRKDNIFATQFHPEKSQRNGLKLLRNFLNHAEEA